MRVTVGWTPEMGDRAGLHWVLGSESTVEFFNVAVVVRSDIRLARRRSWAMRKTTAIASLHA